MGVFLKLGLGKNVSPVAIKLSVCCWICNHCDDMNFRNVQGGNQLRYYIYAVVIYAHRHRNGFNLKSNFSSCRSNSL